MSHECHVRRGWECVIWTVTKLDLLFIHDDVIVIGTCIATNTCQQYTAEERGYCRGGAVMDPVMGWMDGWMDGGGDQRLRLDYKKSPGEVLKTMTHTAINPSVPSRSRPSNRLRAALESRRWRSCD